MAIYFLPPPTHPNDLLEIEEAAAIAYTCTKTVRRRIASGKLPAKQESNRRWYIRREDVETFAASMKSTVA
ncbi:helix-turn-helix domain-containing protein [Rhodococcus hoagii]|nr:helix-turn-helix domain-containing protein [Prescottella equi]